MAGRDALKVTEPTDSDGNFGGAVGINPQGSKAPLKGELYIM